jgi:hypothetical protein
MLVILYGKHLVIYMEIILQTYWNLIMNELTWKLAQQCSSPECFDVKKFAELIVRECSNWLKQPVNQTPSCGVTMNIAADRLKEHFGVEE